MSLASDIPGSWTSPERMVKAMVTYIHDDNAVRQAVRDQYGNSPSLEEIARFRKQYERNRRNSGSEYSTTGPALDFRDPSISAQRKADRKFLNALYLTYPGRRPAR